MAVIAYMVTWTTYGTWLQGDRRGWVKDGTIYCANPALEDVNRRQLKTGRVTLVKEQRVCVAGAITDEAGEIGQKIFALAVCTNHVHLVVQNIDLSIGRAVSHYKHAARLTLQRQGFDGRLWTKGFDKRYCYCMNDEELGAKIAYIHNHRNTDAEVIVSPPIYSAGNSK